MKKSVLTSIIMLLSCWVVYGQMSTQEAPVSFRTTVSALKTSEKTVKSFVSLDMNKIER